LGQQTRGDFQGGIYLHLSAVADLDIPIMLYNVPGRTGVNLTPAVALRLENGSATVNDARGAREASRELIRDARGLAISCGVLTPEMMDAPTAGVEWWDFSS